MSAWLQRDVLTALRDRLDDQVDGKPIFNYQPLLPAPDGTNTIFRIPQSRIQDYPLLTVYENGVALNAGSDYFLADPMMGTIRFTVAPAITTVLSADFYWTWFTDQELDRHLVRGANELGLSTYHTDPATVLNTEVTNPLYLTDMPDGLKTALILFAGMHAAAALANRFSMRYNTGFGDQQFSLSDLAKNFQARVAQYGDDARTSRDDFYKKQGRQFDPATAHTGFVLPFITPRR